MTAGKRKVVAAIQPGNRKTVFTPEAQARLAAFAEVVNLGHDGPFTAEQLAAALPHAAGVITCWGTPKITVAMARRAPNLKIIAHSAGSLRPCVDREILDLGIIVTSQAGAIANAVAEFAIGMILSGLRLTWQVDRMLQASRDWKAGGPPPELCWEIEGRTIGVISLSRVGQLVAQKLAVLGANVIAYDPYAPAEAFQAAGARKARLEEIFELAGVVTVHAPVTDQTERMITADLLRRLPDGALIVNTARGIVFDQPALEAELLSGRLRAALDVTDPEPPPAESRLYGLPNVLLTPHQAGLSVEARRRQGLGAVEDVRKALAGEEVRGAVTAGQWDILA